MILYFSGTGNSAYAAEALADRLQDEAVCSNEYIKNNKEGVFQSETPWIFVFPVYCHSIAEIFADFIMASKFRGSRKAYFVATCKGYMGIVPDAALRICKKSGLQYMGSAQITMPQNYIALFTMTEHNEIERLQKAALVRADEIAQAVSEGKSLDAAFHSSIYTGLMLAIGHLYNKFLATSGKFYVKDSCISCGVCEQVCPLNNVKLQSGKPKWGKNCVHCMACINRCPKGAIEYGKGSVQKERYVCIPYVKESMNTEEQK